MPTGKWKRVNRRQVLHINALNKFWFSKWLFYLERKRTSRRGRAKCFHTTWWDRFNFTGLWRWQVQVSHFFSIIQSARQLSFDSSQYWQLAKLKSFNVLIYSAECINKFPHLCDLIIHQQMPTEFIIGLITHRVLNSLHMTRRNLPLTAFMR